VDAVSCARCRDLRAALDAGDDARLLELLEDLYGDDGTAPGSEWGRARSGAAPTPGEAEGRPPRTREAV
jgi:hypothetical protein